VSGLALLLVLTAALCHASWNLLAKRAGGGLAFLWLFAVMGLVLYAPLAMVSFAVQRPPMNLEVFLCVAASGLLHILYFALLQLGYRVGDLSLVYPLARGTGPLLSILAAVLLLGERPSSVALAGTALVIASVFVLGSGRPSDGTSHRRAAVGFALLTGVSIASYTIVDKYAVTKAEIPPLLLDYCSSVVRTLVLCPFVVRNWGAVRVQWRTHRREALGIAILAPLAYFLVLTAMTFTPVSYVAPAREVSILFATLLGARLLGEGHATRRLAAAAAMVVGIGALAFG